MLTLYGDYAFVLAHKSSGRSRRSLLSAVVGQRVSAPRDADSLLPDFIRLADGS